VEFLKRETPEFISPLLWPLNSPDLNLVDYSVCSKCKRSCTRHTPFQTSHQNQNRVGQAASRHHCCSCASVASPSFSLCQGGLWSFRALLFILTLCFCNTCGLWSLHSLFKSNSWYYGLIFLQLVVSYDGVRWSFNSQGKVVTLLRCSGHLLCWFGFALSWRHSVQKLQLYIFCLLCLKHYWFHFFGHGVHKAAKNYEKSKYNFNLVLERNKITVALYRTPCCWLPKIWNK